MATKKKSAEDKSTEKAFHMRMPRATWILLKKAAITNDCTMGDIIVDLVEKSRVKMTRNFEEIGELQDLR